MRPKRITKIRINNKIGSHRYFINYVVILNFLSSVYSNLNPLAIDGMVILGKGMPNAGSKRVKIAQTEDTIKSPIIEATILFRAVSKAALSPPDVSQDIPEVIRKKKDMIVAIRIKRPIIPLIMVAISNCGLKGFLIPIITRLRISASCQ